MAAVYRDVCIGISDVDKIPYTIFIFYLFLFSSLF